MSKLEISSLNFTFYMVLIHYATKRIRGKATGTLNNFHQPDDFSCKICKVDLWCKRVLLIDNMSRFEKITNTDQSHKNKSTVPLKCKPKYCNSWTSLIKCKCIKHGLVYILKMNVKMTMKARKIWLNFDIYKCGIHEKWSDRYDEE